MERGRHQVREGKEEPGSDSLWEEERRDGKTEVAEVGSVMNVPFTRFKFPPGEQNEH